MVHRGGLECSTEKNKKDDFNSCIAENAKTADDDMSNNKIEESAPKAKQVKKSAKKAPPKSTTLPLSDHSISQTVVRLERSRLIKTKNNPSSKAADASSGSKSKRLSPVRAGLRSSSLESHTSTTSNNNNAKAKKKKVNTKKGKATERIECPPKQTVDQDSKNAQQPKLSKQLPLSLICSLPLNRLSGILEKIKTDKTKCLSNVEEDTSSEDKSNVDKNSSQCKTLCLYCDKRMSTVKVRARHIERFHTISKERRSSSRNPITPSSQDSKDLIGTTSACSSSSAPSTPMSSTTNLYFSGCSYCSKSPKLQAVALENDLSALFFHLIDFHSDKYFGCKVCAIRFQTSAKLSDHVQRIHSSSEKSCNPVIEDVKPTLASTEEERIANEIGKSTPTKTRRQMKQMGTDVPLPTTNQVATSSSIINRNESMFSNDEPILSRLGLTQNRLPRGRKGIRSRRQTNVDSVKPDTSLIAVKTRSKLGRFNTSNEPVEAVFRTPTNTRIEPLSCTFDEDFYENVFNNVRTNLSCHLDGKIGSDTDSNRPQSPPPLLPAIPSTVVKSPQVLESEVHTATSLAALTAFPTLLTAEQYGCDFGTAKIKRPITRHSWKWKWDSVKKYKYVNEGGKIVKKIKQPMLGLRDLSKLDMWTQLTMRQKHEVVRKQSEATNSQSLVEYTDNSREEKQRQVDQLNTILDSRRLPQIILEQSEQTIIKLEITEEGFRYLAGEVSSCMNSTDNEVPSTSQAIDRIIPANLNLIPSRSLGESLRHSVVLSGEWARPRCYVCFGCGARFDKRKALEEHKMFRHPHVYSTHYEIVGRELIEGNLYKHFFIPLKALSRHKEYAQRILVNKKTDYSVSKSSSNSGNEEESLDSLHSVTASFTTLSSSKLSDDCDTDTKTAIENVSSFPEPLSPLLSKNDTNSSAAGCSSSMDCTKCNRNCHGMLELYRHMLDCSGDYAWILAKKKKYRYYGSRKRRQFNRQNISTLHLHRRKVKVSKDENESDETPKKKYMSPSTPRPRASDADSIRKMLENLPPKRVCREIIPNATKPRSRKFKTTASGRKIQQNSTNNCKTSNTTLSAISKKILRNHKLRAISEKDKISRNKKILETKRKSARVKSRVIANKNVHSQNKKANKKTEMGRGGIVRKIGTTTKRFVKKIKKRLLGDKSDNNTATKNDKVKPTEEEKKPSKVSAVRKLTFDKEHEVVNKQDITSNSGQDKTLVTVSCTTEEKENFDNKIEKPDLSSSEAKCEIPTITIETNCEPKKLQDAILNEDLSLSLRSEGSTENLHEQQSDLSASTEDLHRLNPGFFHNQVSPTTKRRSKKINDCIAMLTGKIQEKLGKPFLECKETQGADKVKTQNNTKANIVLPSPEIKDTKPTKRKALTRKIVKCDQSSGDNVDVLTPEKLSFRDLELPLQIDSPTKQSLIKRSSTKQSQLQIEHNKESLEIEPQLIGTLLKQSLSDLPTASKVSKLLPEKPALNEEALPNVSKFLLKETSAEIPSLIDPKLKEIVLMKPPFVNPLYKDPNLKEPYLMESLLKESPLKNLAKELQLKNTLKEPPLGDTLLKENSLQPFKPPFEDQPTNSVHSQSEPPRKKELPLNQKVSLSGLPSTGTVFGNTQLLSSFNTDLRKPQDVPPPYTNSKTIPGSRIPPSPVTIEIVTPAPVLLNEIVPKKHTKQPLLQQCVINAATIRVPSVKPPQQLSIPKFMPLQHQVPAPRGMITKRRQTIAGAPNDFLYDMNSLRCGNAYNNLPFELEVPLDLSKKPKRASPKAKQITPKVAPLPVHFPQISVKPNAVLMPPVPYQLPILPQTQIIPIMCESLPPKVAQIPLQNPPIIFPKEITNKPTTSTTRKRTTNSKKQDPIVNIIPTLVNVPIDAPTSKKFSKKITTPVADEKIKPTCNPLSTENTSLIKESILSLPVESNNKTTFKENAATPEPKICFPAEVSTNIPKQTTAIIEQPNSTQPTKTILPSDEVTPDQSPVIIASSILEVTNPEPEQKISKVDPKETKKTKTNKKPIQVTTSKKGSLSPSSILTSNQVYKTGEPLGKNEYKNGSSPESQKSFPTRRSRRNKITEQSEVKKPATPNNSAPITLALKEVEEIAASFLSDDELENECTDLPTKKQQEREESTPSETIIETPKQPEEQPKIINEVVETMQSEHIPNPSQQKDDKIDLAEEKEVVAVKNSTESEPTTKKQDPGKKPRRRRKNELASIVADQLMESFKETDKSRIDDLKRLEELAYEKSEDLLLTGMRLMPTTKRKNVLENKKDLSAELEPKVVYNSVKESKKQKAESAKEKSSTLQKEDLESKPKTELAKEKENTSGVQKDDAELFKDPKDLQKVEMKLKNQTEPAKSSNQPKLICKDDLKIKPLPIDFGSYRSNSVDSWSNRGSKQQNTNQVSPLNDKSPTSETLSMGHKDKKNKKKQMKKRDKKIEIENINQLRTGLESFTFSKDVVDNGSINVTGLAAARISEDSHSIIGLFSPTATQAIAAGVTTAVSKDVSPFGSFSNVKTSSSILRPSILAASLDVVASNKENPQQSADRKSNISSRDPRLNKNIHTEEGDQVNVPPETTSRLATLRTRRKSFADATPPTYTSRANSRSTPSKRSSGGSRRNSLAFDDDEDDNYLTAIAKRVNDKIMSAEDKDFNLANDGFELASSFLDQDDTFGRPSTSMSVRSAPNFNEDRSNMDTMDATNTDLIDMDVDDDMSVYTTFSQDTTRSKGGRRRRRRRSVLLTRKPKKTNVNMMDSMETFDCLLCNKKFAKAVALNKHQLTIAHVSKVSEQEYLNATRKQEEEKEKAETQQTQSKEVSSAAKPATTPPSLTTEVADSPKQYFNVIQSIRLEESNAPLKVTEIQEKTAVEKVQKHHQPKVPFIPPNSILNQSGIEPISSPEQNYERYSTKTSSRLTLNPDERLFYECCNILKGSETPLVERNYPIVPPTTYAYDLQVKPVTPKSPNERFSYMKQSISETNGKREAGSYPRLDVNQFSDISSDSNPACAQPPPVLPVNYAQMHVLSGAKDQAFLTNDVGGGGTQRSNLPRESSILQMASIVSPNLITPAPLTARTFVNQPSQIGAHIHGMESSAAGGQKQNFISPLHSASSQSSTITTTTCRLKTKAAMKGYDNLKVSIPTIGLDMEHALERSPRPGCKLTTLADIALGNETPHTTFTPSLQIHNDQKSKGKQKPSNNDTPGNFPIILQSQPKQNQASPNKKRDNSLIKECSIVISVHDTESCMPIVLCSPKKTESIIPKDIYEFDDSENTPISKAIQSPFKIAEDNEAGPKKAIIIPERPFKNIGMEEKEAIKFQKPETPAINDENTTSTVTYSDRDDFVYGSMSGGDDDNDNDNDNDDNKETHVESEESSNSSAFTAKTFENKSLIMGRIFKNAKTKPKLSIEKPVLPTPEPPKQIPKQELDRLFDTLRGVNENRQNAKEERPENTPNSSRKRESQSTKRKATVIAKAAKPKTTTNKPNKRAIKKNEQQTSKEMSQLHAELGMSPAEIAELIGEGQRKSQRRCAVNRPKKLVEIWSSDEFEEFLSTKDIIALIEEKEQKTKKKRKTTSTSTKKSNSTPATIKNNKKYVDEQSVTQSEDDKSESAPASPQKSLINNAPETSKAAKVANATKNTKTPKGKKKSAVTISPTVTPKVTARAQKETKPTSSGKSSIESTKNNSSPFKKPTQKNIISKIAADDSESDFEAELNRRTKTAGPIRNRRKTISGKLENDAGSSSNCAKKVSGKSKTEKSDARNSSKTKAIQPSPADSSQNRPQARRKRIASEMLYYWSSSSDEEFGRIESPHDDEHHIDESENYQQHGWIVGDSHKKLVTLLAIAKGNKKVDDCGVKETSSKKKS